jgi:hypothetical protein
MITVTITVTVKVTVKVTVTARSRTTAESIDGGPPSQGTPATSTLLVRSSTIGSPRFEQPHWAR